PHQPLDPVQSAEPPFGCKILPPPPGAVGAVAAEETCTHLGAECLVVTAALDSARSGDQIIGLGQKPDRQHDHAGQGAVGDHWFALTPERRTTSLHTSISRATSCAIASGVD